MTSGSPSLAQAGASTEAGGVALLLDAPMRARSSDVSLSGPSSLQTPGSLPSQRPGLGRTAAKPQRAVEELLTALRKASSARVPIEVMLMKIAVDAPPLAGHTPSHVR